MHFCARPHTFAHERLQQTLISNWMGDTVLIVLFRDARWANELPLRMKRVWNVYGNSRRNQTYERISYWSIHLNACEWIKIGYCVKSVVVAAFLMSACVLPVLWIAWCHCVIIGCAACNNCWRRPKQYQNISIIYIRVCRIQREFWYSNSATASIIVIDCSLFDIIPKQNWKRLAKKKRRRMIDKLFIGTNSGNSAWHNRKQNPIINLYFLVFELSYVNHSISLHNKRAIGQLDRFHSHRCSFYDNRHRIRRRIYWNVASAFI